MKPVNVYYEKTTGIWIHAVSYVEAYRIASKVRGVANPALQKF